MILRHRVLLLALLALLAVILLVACSPVVTPAATSVVPTVPAAPSDSAAVVPTQPPPTVPPAASDNLPVAPTQPLTAPPATSVATVPSEQVNVRVEDTNQYTFPQLIPFDGIPPVYDPEFAAADDAPLLDDELVLGIALAGEAKAYPVTVLRFREMVNDELAGIPILVTW